MFWSKEAKLQRIERKIAGHKAELVAVKELAVRVNTLPGHFAVKLTSLPREIAELEKRIDQLKAPNETKLTGERNERSE